MTPHRLALVFLAVVAGGAFGACSDASDGGAVFIDMKDNFFGRAVTRVPVGDSVLFRNDGNSPHNAVAADDSWSTEETSGELPIEPGNQIKVTIDEPGVYEYFCTYHGSAEGDGMAAVLVVGEVDYDPAGGEVEQATVARSSGRTLEVPADHDTIQAAVDDTEPGDLVLIGPGTYREEVTVTTPSVTLRGTDPDEVIIDAEFERPNGVEVFADGVAIENMTAQNAILNGFVWTSVEGYRGSYLNAFNNADYGIFAFDSVDGVFEESYASGSTDSGFYIGQCNPCRAVINRVTAEGNSLGYSGTNAGGDLYIVNSRWIDNRAGIVPNTLDTELLPPERDTTIVGNSIVNNDNHAPPAKPGTYAAFGNGIVIAGGRNNHVSDNRIDGHDNHGILVTPNFDENFWISAGNHIRANVITNSGRADLALSGLSGPGNCFSDNSFVSSTPPLLELLNGCGRSIVPLGGDLSTMMAGLAYTADAPSELPSLDAVAAQEVVGGVETGLPVDAPVRPAVDVFANYDHPRSVAEHMGIGRSEDEVSDMLSGPSPWQLLFGLYGYLLPFVLYAAWTSLAFWDLARREDASRSARLGWIAVILLIPFLGVIAYHAVGKSSIPLWLRAAVVGGGLAAYLLVLGLGAIIGGIV